MFIHHTLVTTDAIVPEAPTDLPLALVIPVGIGRRLGGFRVCESAGVAAPTPSSVRIRVACTRSTGTTPATATAATTRAAMYIETARTKQDIAPEKQKCIHAVQFNKLVKV